MLPTQPPLPSLPPPQPSAALQPLLTLLTDFGTRDYYVAAVKGTVLRLAPGAQLVDLSHEVPPGDIAAASFLLAAAAPAFPTGTLHLAVVDPGVGSNRRILAVETAGARFVAPDNGLLTPFLPSPADSAATIVAVERPDLFLNGAGSTFHGRDRFAPVAAYLLRGEPLADLGPRIADAVRLAPREAQRQASLLSGEVIHIDRFGNLVTNIPAAWLPPPPSTPAAGGASSQAPESAEPAQPQHPQHPQNPQHPQRAQHPQIVARVGSHSALLLADHYHQIPRHQAAVLAGSQGTLELAMRDEDLARRWGVTTGAAVRVRWS